MGLSVTVVSVDAMPQIDRECLGMHSCTQTIANTVGKCVCVCVEKESSAADP